MQPALLRYGARGRSFHPGSRRFSQHEIDMPKTSVPPMATKTELVDALSAATDLPKVTCALFIKELGELAHKNLKAGKDVLIPGIARISAVKRAARKARNPSTGAEIKVPAKTVPRFKAVAPIKTL